VPVALITGSGGLIGSECVARFAETGYDVVGIENNMRARFFGPDASTARTSQRLRRPAMTPQDVT
jgi:CDP-paratose 2-epimerase